MEKIITVKQYNCKGCLFVDRDHCCDIAEALTHIDCVDEGVIFLLKEESEEN